MRVITGSRSESTHKGVGYRSATTMHSLTFIAFTVSEKTARLKSGPQPNSNTESGLTVVFLYASEVS